MMLNRRKYGYNLFDELFKDPFFTNSYEQSDTSLMKTDIQEKNDYYMLDIELPGYQKENVQAELKDGYLTITASRTEEASSDDNSRYLRRERFAGTCKRSFYVGDQVEQEDIKAGFKDGILKICIPKEIPKKIEEKPTFIQID